MQKIILTIIFLLAAFLRLQKISTLPPSLFSDEVDAAYQAFVFNHCQTDFYGNKFPTHFHSYSDWRSPLYIYSLSLSQKIFGLNEFSTRFPAALFGWISVLIIFLLVKQLFDSKTAIFSALLLALSPWHIHYSRAAFEVTGMLLVYLTGFYFFIKFIKEKKFYQLLLSAFFFILSFYFYSTAKLYVFFTLIVIFFIFKKTFLKLKLRQITIFVLFCFLLSLPMISDLISGQAGYRFSYINIFADPTVPQSVDFFRRQDSIIDQSGGQTLLNYKIFHNKILSWITAFTKNYLSSFSTDFLFISGDNNLRHSFSFFGQLLYLDFFLLPFGAFLFFTGKTDKKIKIMILLLFLLSPVPSSFTNDSTTAHATRLFFLIPFFIIFSSQTLVCLKQKPFFLLIFSLFYLFNFQLFYHYYQYHYPQISAPYWHTGIKQAVIDSNNFPASKIYFSSKPEPILPFFLFWNQYLPQDTCNIESKVIQFSNPAFTGKQLENKHYFGQIEWGQMVSKIDPHDSPLFIVHQDEIETIELQTNSSPYKIDVQKTTDTNYQMAKPYLIFKFTKK